MRTPLVLVHGFMGGSDQWAHQAPLGQGRELIGVDLPGFGKNVAMEPIDSIAGFADWVLSEMTRRGVERFDLLGHSMGGMIVQEMTRQAPDHIEKLILYGTGAVGVLPGRFEPIETSMRRARTDGPRATAHRICATWFLHNEAAPEYAACAAIAEQVELSAILAGLEAMQAWSGMDHLEKITASTLIIWGDSDRTYPWSQTETLWRTIPSSQLAVLPGCSHAAHLERPGLFNQVLEYFLKAA